MRKVIKAFSTCKEIRNLNRWVKEAVENNAHQIKSSINENFNMEYYNKLLLLCRYIKDKQELLEPLKSCLRETNLLNKFTPQSAVQMAERVYPFVEDNDLVIYDHIYQYFKNNMRLFPPQDIQKLERIYYEVQQALRIETPMVFPEHINDENFKMSKIYQNDYLQSRGVIIHSSWSLKIKKLLDNNNQVIITDNKTKNKGVIQSLENHSLFDLIAAKELITSHNNTFLVQLPPFSIKPQAGFLEVVAQKIDTQTQFTLDDIQSKINQKNMKDYMDNLNKKLILNQTQGIFSGNLQGYNVPYVFESILHYIEQNLPKYNIELIDLLPDDRIKTLFSSLSSPENYLNYIKLQWLVDVFLWSIDVGRHGCLNCSKNATFLPQAWKYVDDLKFVKDARAKHIANRIREYIREKNVSVFIEKDILADVLKYIVGSNINEDLYPKDQEGIKVNYNEEILQNYLKLYQQFETHQNQLEKPNKVKNNSILNLAQFNDFKWKKSEQLKCAARDILF